MFKGKLSVWRDDKGFGFIKPSHGGQKIFLHITAFKNFNVRPKTGDIIHYQLTHDKKGKVCACNASVEGFFWKPSPLILKTLGLLILPLWGSFKCALSSAILIPVILYPVMSFITFRIYAHDKSCAQKGQRRVPEKTLHLCELAGGWPGAFIAQQKLRHKTRKGSYQVIFRLIVLVHLLFWISWLFFGLS